MIEQGTIKKQFGEIIVQQSTGNQLVSIMTQGCVICFYESCKVDGESVPELREVSDRIMSMNLNKDDFWDAITWGRKLAEVLV